jgi:hypothetical protein
MKRHLLFPILALMLAAASPAAAQCFADYKAKRDNPLQLHYGVVELPEAACGSTSAASSEIARRIGRDGWTLLNVVSIFGQDGLEERRANAGEYFLRY